MSEHGGHDCSLSPRPRRFLTRRMLASAESKLVSSLFAYTSGLRESQELYTVKLKQWRSASLDLQRVKHPKVSEIL